MSNSEDNVRDSLIRLHRAPEMVPPKSWMPRVYLYSDEINGAGFAGSAFSSSDCIVVQGASRGWIIDAESGIMLSDRKDDAAGIDTVGLAKHTPDGWTAELVIEPDHWDIAVLVAPGVSLFAGAFPGWDVVTKIKSFHTLRAWGFSPSGNTLVLLAPGMVWSYWRSRE